MSQMTDAAQQRIVPPGASLVPDHPQCRLAGHQGLRWTEDTEPQRSTGTRTRIVAAQCTDCGRDQARVRVVYPPSRTITVTSPTPEPEPADMQNAPENSTGQ
jgi:hypothetical protein